MSVDNSGIGQFSDFIEVPFSFDKDAATQLSERLGLKFGLNDPPPPEFVPLPLNERETLTQRAGRHLRHRDSAVSGNTRMLAKLLVTRSRMALGESPFTEGGFLKTDMLIPTLPIVQ